MTQKHPFDLVVGLDRSDAKADLCLIETRTGRRRRQTIATAPEILATWLAKLREQHPKTQVALCVEQPAGNLIAFFEAYSFITLYPINPITLQKYREAFVTSRAKDDGKDAEHLAELLLIHYEKLSPWQPEDQPTRLLQQLVFQRRGVVDHRTALTNELQAMLKQYFPQALELCGDQLWRPLATAFLLKWSTLQAVKRARPQTLRRFYYLQGSRSRQCVDQRVERIAQAVALTEDEALLVSFSLRVQTICRQLQVVQRAIQAYEEQIQKALAQHSDRAIFVNLPGAGSALAPRLLAALGSRRERFPTQTALQSYSGIAPVTKQSGGKRHVHRRYLCPKFLRQSFHEFAAQTIRYCRWAAAYYLQQTKKGARHHVAVRALAYKWQRIIWRCWQNRTIYSDADYEAALRKSKSPLVALFNEVQLVTDAEQSSANQ